MRGIAPSPGGMFPSRVEREPSKLSLDRPRGRARRRLPRGYRHDIDAAVLYPEKCSIGIGGTMGSEAIAAGVPSSQRVIYASKPGLIGLLSKNYFLTLVTIGVYRFWAATKLRRYLWSNIEVAGDGLEYTGTGRELFLGFLVAMAVLLPLSIAYAVANRLSLGNPLLAG